MVPRGHRPLRPRRGRPLPEGDRDDGRDRRVHRRPDRARLRLRGRGRRLLPRRALRGVRPPLGAAARPGGGAGAEPAQGGPARLRALEGEQAGRGHVVGLAVGPRPAGLAHRVLGDGGEAARPVVRDPRRRARPRLPAPRERARAVAGARARVRARSGCTTACSASPARRCRSRSATSRRSRRCSTGGAARRRCSSSSRRTGASPIDFSDETMGRPRRRSGGASATRSRRTGRAGRGGGLGAPSRRRSTTTSTRREALARHARVAAASQLDLLRRGLDLFGLGLAAASRRRPRSSSSGRARQQARAATRLRRGRTGCATRSRPPGWEVRDEAGGFRLVRGVTREQVYGRRPVREALRGPREVLELWATERAVGGRAVAAATARASRSSPTGSSARRPGRATTRACSPGASRTATPTRTSSRRSSAPLLACLDQVTDPRNLGAVIRSAEGAGATGVVVPAHGSARVTPAVCRASAGAVEHLPVAVVPNLARYLNEIKRGDLWIYAAARRGRAGPVERRPDRRPRARLRRRGQGRAAARAARLRRDGLDPARRQVESLNVSVAAALLLYEARRRRGDG